MSRSMTGAGKLDINPTHTFFLQYTAQSKPAQSMQNLNKVSKVGEIIAAEKNDGAVSDSSSSLTEGGVAGKKRRPSMAKALVILGLSKKSSSTNSLAPGKRLVFPRSEEVGMAPELRNRFTQRGERDPSADEEKKSDASEQPKARFVPR